MNDEERIIADYNEGSDEHPPEVVAGALIAYALESVASAIRALGNGNATTSMGAVEALSVHLRGGLDGIAAAVSQKSEES